MKRVTLFLLYFLLGLFLIFSYRQVNQVLSSQQLVSPLAKSSFSLEIAPSKSLKGTIVPLLGDVGWQSRTATQPAQITKPKQVQQGEEITTKDNGQATVVFSNAVNAIIYPKTKLNFIQTLPDSILFEQNEGVVDYNKLGSYPLSVKSNGLLTKINQGEIIISINKEFPYIVIDVKSGSITIAYNDIDYVTQTLDVNEKKRLIFNTDTRKVSVRTI